MMTAKNNLDHVAVVLNKPRFSTNIGAAARAIKNMGLGRMVLSYPEMPSDVLAGKTLARKKICRTFSDCTTAPRKGLISGCYPLDDVYKAMPEAEQLKAIKAGL